MPFGRRSHSGGRGGRSGKKKQKSGRKSRELGEDEACRGSREPKELERVFHGTVCTVFARRPLSSILASVFSVPNSFGGFELGYTCAHNLAWEAHGADNGRAGLEQQAVDKRSVIYEGELYKVGENLRVRTQRRAQVYPGLLVYSGAWNAAASNIPLDSAQVYTSREDLLHFHVTVKSSRGQARTYKFCARTQAERSQWIQALGQAKEYYLYVVRRKDRRTKQGVVVWNTETEGRKAETAEMRRQLSQELQPLDVILSLVVGETEIAVRDADTLTSLVHDANVPKVKLRVVRFFNQSDAEDLLISGGVGWHSSFSRNSFTAELLLPPVDANGLARRLAYVPDISQALAGKKMHHRWMERLGDGAGPGGVATTQRRPQSTSLNHFPTEALVAENVPSGADNQRPRGNTTDMVLNALQPVHERVYDRLVFRQKVFEGFEGAQNSMVKDGSVLVAIGPINVFGLPLENVRQILTEADCADLRGSGDHNVKGSGQTSGRLFHFVNGKTYASWREQQDGVVQAASRGDIGAVHRMYAKWSNLAFFDINKIYSDEGHTILYAAVLGGCTDVAHMLLHLDCTPQCVVTARNLSPVRGVVYAGNALHAAARNIARMPDGHVDLDIFVKLFQHKPSVMGAALLCEDEHGLTPLQLLLPSIRRNEAALRLAHDGRGKPKADDGEAGEKHSLRASYDAELGRRSAEIFNEMAQTSIMPPTYQPPAALDLSEQYSGRKTPLITGNAKGSGGSKHATKRTGESSSSKVQSEEDNIARARFEAQLHPTSMKSVFFFRSSHSLNQLFQQRPESPRFVRLVLPKIFSHRAALLKLSQHLGLVRLASDQTSASITGGNGADDGWTDAINQPSDTADPLTAAAVFSGSGWVQVQHDDLRTEAGEERVSPGTVCDVRTFRESVAQLVKLDPVSPETYTPAVDDHPIYGAPLVRASLWKILLGYYNVALIPDEARAASNFGRHSLRSVDLGAGDKVTLDAASKTWPEEVTKRRNAYSVLVQGYGLDLMDCSDGSLTTGLRSFVDGVKEHVLRFGEAPDADSEAARQTRDFLKLVRQVYVDVDRCRKELPRQHQAALARILIVFGRLRGSGQQRAPLDGYVQGMHDIASVLFLVFLRDGLRGAGDWTVTGNDCNVGQVLRRLQPATLRDIEADTFFCLHALLSRLHPFFDFRTGLPKALRQIEECLKVVDPELSLFLAHLEAPIAPQLYCLPWILTMFSQAATLTDVLPLWDALLASGGNVVDVRSALLSATGGHSGNSGLSPELFANIVQVQTTGVDLDFLVSCVVATICSCRELLFKCSFDTALVVVQRVRSSVAPSILLTEALHILSVFKKHRKFAADGTSLADEASADSDLFSSSTHINASASPGKAKGRVAPGLEEGVAVGGRPTRAEKKRLRVYCRAIEEHRARLQRQEYNLLDQGLQSDDMYHREWVVRTRLENLIKICSMIDSREREAVGSDTIESGSSALGVFAVPSDPGSIEQAIPAATSSVANGRNPANQSVTRIAQDDRARQSWHSNLKSLSQFLRDSDIKSAKLLAKRRAADEVPLASVESERMMAAASAKIRRNHDLTLRYVSRILGLVHSDDTVAAADSGTESQMSPPGEESSTKNLSVTGDQFLTRKQRSPSYANCTLADVLRKNLDILSTRPRDADTLQSNTVLPPATRSTLWKLLLGYLPCFEPFSDTVVQQSDGVWALGWEAAVTSKRRAYKLLLQAHCVDNLQLTDMDKPTSPDALANRKLYRQIYVDLIRVNFRFPKEFLDSLARILVLQAKLNSHTGYVQGMHEIAWVLFHQFLTDGVAAALQGPPQTPQGRATWSTISKTPAEAEADVFFCLYDVLTRLHPFYMFEKDMSHILDHTRACLNHEYPNISEHFRNMPQSIEMAHFSMPWFLTLFAQKIEYDDLLPLWDILFSSGLHTTSSTSLRYAGGTCNSHDPRYSKVYFQPRRTGINIGFLSCLCVAMVGMFKEYMIDPSTNAGLSGAGFVECMEVLQRGIGGQQVYQLVIRATLISKVYNEIRRTQHDELRNKLKDSLIHAVRAADDAAGPGTSPAEGSSAVGLRRPVDQAALSAKADAAEEDAKQDPVAHLRTLQTCFHERMLRQQLDDAVELFSSLRQNE